MPARPGPRPTLPTFDVLFAVATRGRRWTSAFRDAEVRTLDEAADRELFSGNMVNPYTLSVRGERLLEEQLGHPNDLVRLDVGARFGCRTHGSCWTLRCARCQVTQLEHVTDAALDDQMQQVVAGHICVGMPSRAITLGASTVARDHGRERSLR